MKIIGIEPAPLKKNVLFDGETFACLSAEELKRYLDGMEEDILICWDAPLNRGTNNGYGGFYRRQIERFLQSRLTGLPAGIGIQGYAASTAWAVSQYCLGYPITNEAYVRTDGYKFRLLEAGCCPERGQFVVETHSSVTLWLLLHEQVRSVEWRYRGKSGSRELRQELVDKLFRLPCFSGELSRLKERLQQAYRLSHEQSPLEVQILESERLDAFVAWLTGFMFRANAGEARVLGDHRSGTMLLAYEREFFNAFEHYLVG